MYDLLPKARAALCRASDLLAVLVWSPTRGVGGSSLGMNHYAKGRAFEYEVAALFRQAGYRVVRSAGSKGPWDLVAMKAGRGRRVVYLVLAQCKRRGR